MKIIIHHDQVGFTPGMQGWHNVNKSIIITYHKQNNKNHMIISIEEEKAFDKVQHTFMIKNTQQSRSRRSSPQRNKGHIWKPPANIILNG